MRTVSKTIVTIGTIITALVLGAGPSAAEPTPPVPIDEAASALLASGPWTSPPVHGEPPEYKCTINASATARIAYIKNPGEPFHLGLLVTTNADIHNPYLFVGCTIRVLVDVLNAEGIILDTRSHDAFAEAWLTGGNNKSYTWVDEADIDATDLFGVAGLEIRLQNVA